MRPILLLSLLSGCVYELRLEQQTITVTEPYSRLSLSSDAGDLWIHGANVTTTTMDLSKEWHGTEPYIDTAVEGDTLYVRVDCRHEPLSRCSVDIDLEVPSEISGVVDLGAGDLSARHLEGDFTAWTGAGDLLLVDMAGEVHVDTGAGDVDGTELSGDEVMASTGAGDVALTMAARFDLLTADTGAGNVDLRVPYGTYWLDLDTGVGTLQTVGILAGGPSMPTIRAHSGAGDIRVFGYPLVEQ